MKRIFLFVFLVLFACSPLFAREIGKLRKIVIDPGHGGNKPGAVTVNSKEKDIVLSVALKLGKLIEDNCSDVEVIYTRKTDADIDLFKRAQIANKAKADLFLSIHVNSSKRSDATGMETYVMGLSKTSANLEVAKKENADILLEDNYKANYEGFDPNSPESHIMFALYQNAFIDKSLEFAAKIQKQYSENIESPNRGVKQAEFLVLYKTAMPALLTEIGFMSNPEEEEFLLSSQGQGEIAYCLFNAFREYKASVEDTVVSKEKVILNIKGFTPGEKVQRKPKTVAHKPEPPSIKDKTKDSNASAQKHNATNKPQTSATKPEVKEEKTVVVAPKADTALQEKTKVEYRIQVLISDTKLKNNDKKFKGLKNLDVYEQNGSYRYTYGTATNLTAAKNLLSEVKAKEFKGAFIVAFYEGKRIDLQEAIKQTEKKN